MLLLLIGLGCNSDRDLKAQGIGTEENQKIEYSLEISSPVYGAFYQDGPIPVQGVVSPADAELRIEGVVVDTLSDGSFTYEVPFAKEYEIVEVEVPQGELRERIPVFSGAPPAETWPGGLTARILPEGLRIIGEQLGALLDETGWSDSLSSGLPSQDWGFAGLNAIGVTHSPTVVALAGAEEGVAVDFTLRDVGVEYELWYSDFSGVMQSSPLSVVFGEIAIGTTAVPTLTEDGVLLFSLVDADLTLDTPDFQFGALEGWILEWIVQQSWNWIVEPISENILDALLGELGTIELGGPFAFETDMMGVDFGVSLADVYGDPDGLAIGMALSLGDLSADGARDMPIPTEQDAPDAQLALGIHEALFHQLLSEELLGMLSQNLDLGGAFGDIIGNGILMLPGGDDAPDGDGWCLSIDPGTATVVRMQQGIAPLALLYAPDMKVEVGIKDGNDCNDWLVASLAAEISLNIKEGSKIGIDFDIAEGALLYYGAEEYDEEEVVTSFSMYLGGLLGLVGGFAEFDLAEILAGGGTGLEGLPLDSLSINIKTSSQLSLDGELMPGLFALAIDLWSTEEQEQIE